MTSEITLVTKLKEMELAPEQTKTLLDSFGDLFVEAHKLVAQGKGIVVTQEFQKEEMALAKEIRIKLMKVRTQAEKTKKLIKEPYLRGAQAAQDIYNDIRGITEPEEERLAEQEKFAEIAEQTRMDKRFSERVVRLGKYVDDLSVYSLREMPEDVFERLLVDCKTVYEARVAAIKKEEEDRLEKIRLEEKRQKEIELENARLKKEAEDRKIVEKMKQEEADKKIKKAEEMREKAERTLREKEEKEQARLDEIARQEANELREKEEAKKKALLAPDKEKLLLFAEKLESCSLPAVSSRDAQIILQDAEELIMNVVRRVREKAREL